MKLLFQKKIENRSPLCILSINRAKYPGPIESENDDKRWKMRKKKGKEFDVKSGSGKERKGEIFFLAQEARIGGWGRSIGCLVTWVYTRKGVGLLKF